MNAQEFSIQFDIYFNNIMSNQAPGLDEYEKSVFLTKAQDEIIKAYFNPRHNKTQEGFDGNERRQIDFSMITKTAVYNKFKLEPALFDTHSNSRRVVIKEPVLFFINEYVIVKRDYYPSKDNNQENTQEEVKEEEQTKQIKEVSNLIIDAIYDNIPEGLSIKGGIFSPQSISDAEAIYFIKNENRVIGIDGDYFSDNWASVRGDSTIPASEYGEIEMGKRVLSTSKTYSVNGFNYTYDGTTLNQVEVEQNEDEDVSIKGVRLSVLPIKYTDYFKLMSKPFTRPSKNQAWRLLDSTDSYKASELIVGPIDEIAQYCFRYIKKPKPIIIGYLGEDITIEGHSFPTYEDGESLDPNQVYPCELDPILHEEILQRAVELAKASWEGGVNTTISIGNSSATDIGVIPKSE